MTLPEPILRPCQHCGSYHGPLCPAIKAIEYHADGSLKRIEFWPQQPADSEAKRIPTAPHMLAQA